MKRSLFFLSLVFLMIACQSDQDHQDAFSGTYEVTIETPEAEKEIRKAKKDVKRELKKARKDIKKEIREAQDDIEEEFGEDSDIGKAISSFVEGMGHLANSMTDLGESLGELGLDLSTDILKDIRFDAEFQRDGEVVFGRKKGIRYRGDDLRWKIEDGEMHLWNEGETPEPFRIKKISENEWDLIGEDVIFHLEKKEK